MERFVLSLLLCLTVAIGAVESAGITGIRLAGEGSTASQGRVEVLYNGRWGTVCDDDFDINDADVICKELGYSEGADTYKTKAEEFGPGEGQIWLTWMECTGTESTINECTKELGPNRGCRHSEDAGVFCKVSDEITAKRNEEFEEEVKKEEQEKKVLSALAELLAQLENK